MGIQSFIKNFEESIEDLEPGSITRDTRYQDLEQWDSLAVLTVTDTIDMEYGVLLKRDDMEVCKTIHDLYTRVIDKTKL